MTDAEQLEKKIQQQAVIFAQLYVDHVYQGTMLQQYKSYVRHDGRKRYNDISHLCVTDEATMKRTRELCIAMGEIERDKNKTA
jgi:hypothetical protein